MKSFGLSEKLIAMAQAELAENKRHAIESGLISDEEATLLKGESNSVWSRFLGLDANKENKEMTAPK